MQKLVEFKLDFSLLQDNLAAVIDGINDRLSSLESHKGTVDKSLESILDRIEMNVETIGNI